MDKNQTIENIIFPPLPQSKIVVSLEDYHELKQLAFDDYYGFWGKIANQYIKWHKPFTKIIDEANHPFYKWFTGGELNVCYNCVDVHVQKRPHAIALICENELGQTHNVTFKELLSEVCQVANALKELGVEKGERVLVYLQHSQTAIVTMLACARIGAIHVVAFAGFSAHSLADRIIDADVKWVVTADAQKRAGQIMPVKAEIDAAIEYLGNNNSVEKVLVYNSQSSNISFNSQRDIWWHDIVNKQDKYCEPEWVESEHPLFILYTSGSTGKPKGVVHSSAGYLVGTVYSIKMGFNLHEGDVYWCTADVGWISGHSFVLYAPLVSGVTSIIFEGVPIQPSLDNFYSLFKKHNIKVFYTAPTLIRSLIQQDSELPGKYDLSSLQVLSSVGESINPEVWNWYYHKFGKSQCTVIDSWGQTELGTVVMLPVVGITPTKAGSCTIPLPGCCCEIIDESSNIINNNATGYLVITKPMPNHLRTLWKNDERFITTYYPKQIGNGKYYVSGDSATKDHDGYFWILGRIDDVLNVSGHRLGTTEIESALLTHPLVAEAAAVGKEHALKGEAIVTFIVLKGKVIPTNEEKQQLIIELRDRVSREISAIAKPDEIHFVPDLPKTRSGKIMRRILRSIADGKPITQDISTLDNPSIIAILEAKTYAIKS